MTWREKTVAKILLLVAQIVAGDVEIRQAIVNLSNAIGTGPPPD